MYLGSEENVDQKVDEDFLAGGGGHPDITHRFLFGWLPWQL